MAVAPAVRELAAYAAFGPRAESSAQAESQLSKLPRSISAGNCSPFLPTYFRVGRLLVVGLCDLAQGCAPAAEYPALFDRSPGGHVGIYAKHAGDFIKRHNSSPCHHRGEYVQGSADGPHQHRFWREIRQAALIRCWLIRRRCRQAASHDVMRQLQMPGGQGNPPPRPAAPVRFACGRALDVATRANSSYNLALAESARDRGQGGRVGPGHDDGVFSSLLRAIHRLIGGAHKFVAIAG